MIIPLDSKGGFHLSVSDFEPNETPMNASGGDSGTVEVWDIEQQYLWSHNHSLSSLVTTLLTAAGPSPTTVEALTEQV